MGNSRNRNRRNKPELSQEDATDQQQDINADGVDDVKTEIDENNVVIDEKEKTVEDTEPSAGSEEIAERDLSSAKKIISFLTEKDITDTDKLDIIATKASVPFSMLVSSLNRYSSEMGENKIVDDMLGSKYNHDLYILIMNVIKEENQDIYTAKMKLISLAFKVNRDNAFTEVMLHRFTKKWTWGKMTLDTYLYLVTIFTMLSDPSKRQENIKHISIQDIIDNDDNLLTKNIVAFFEN